MLTKIVIDAQQEPFDRGICRFGDSEDSCVRHGTAVLPLMDVPIGRELAAEWQMPEDLPKPAKNAVRLGPGVDEDRTGRVRRLGGKNGIVGMPAANVHLREAVDRTK